MYHGHVDIIFKAFLKIRSHLGDLTPAKAGHKRNCLPGHSRTNCPRRVPVAEILPQRKLLRVYNGHVDTILKAFLKIRSHLGDLAPAKAGHKNDRNLIENFSLAFAFSPKSMTARQPTTKLRLCNKVYGFVLILVI